MAKVLAVKGSVRANGNTDRLVDEARAGALEAGHDVTDLVLRKQRFSGCINCGGCRRDGRCHVKDDMQDVFTLLNENEHLILGAPMFFMDLPWNVKAMIDRAQVYWARKYILKTDTGRKHPGGNLLALLVGGTKFPHLFDASRIVLKAYCHSLGMKLHMGVTLRNIDAPGDIDKVPEALVEARDLGRRIAEL